MMPTTILSQRYELLDELGRGGMAVVYRAEDPLLGRQVAVKVMPLERPDDVRVRRFEREARLAARLDHPAIVPIFDFGRDGEHLYLVMPIVPGRTLFEQLKRGGLSPTERLKVGARVAEALAHGAARGVVHRDIKPENIMVAHQEDGGLRVWVMDFGLALAPAASRITRAEGLPGTLAYLSPEQVLSQPVGGATDVWALGTVLYEALGGGPPFAGPPAAVLYRIAHEAPPSLTARGVEPEVAAVVLSCLNKEPGERPAARELADRLWDLVGRRSGEGSVAEVARSPVSAAVLDAAADAAPVSEPPASRPTLVGRRREMAALEGALARALGGECQLVLVGGDTGLGKTRLIEELEVRARARGCRVLHGRFADSEVAFPYQAFCEVLLDFFRQPEIRWSPVADAFTDLAEGLLSLFPALHEVPELEKAGEAVRPSRPEMRERLEVFELLASTLARLARFPVGRPLEVGAEAVSLREPSAQVLLLEHLHVADVSVELLRYLSRRLGPTPTMIVATFASEEVDRGHPLAQLQQGRSDDPNFLLLALEPLPEREHRQLVEAQLGGPVPEPLAERLLEVSEGNPLFTLELLRALRDSGEPSLDAEGIDVGDGSWATDEAPGTMALAVSAISEEGSGAWRLAGQRWLALGELPETIHQVVERRLERLDEEKRQLLEVASVLGHRFEFDHLAELVGDRRMADRVVDRLIDDELLEEDTRSRGDALLFRSAVMREALYLRLPRRRRRRLHRQHAEALEARHGERPERVALALLRHWAAAEEPGPVLRFGALQARRSLAAGSWDDTVRVARTALSFAGEEEGDDRMSGGAGVDRLALEGELRYLLAAALRSLGRLEAALREAARAVRLEEGRGAAAEVVRAALEAARSAWQARKVEETEQWVERGLRQPPESTGPHRRELLLLASTLANLQGDYRRARGHLEAARRSAIEEEGLLLPAGGELIVALTASPTTEDPAHCRTIEDLEVLGNIFETLLCADEEGHLHPGLARLWSWGEGRRRLDFELEAGVCFSDGTPVDAMAVKHSLERAARRDSFGIARTAWSALVGIEAFLARPGGNLEGVETRGELGLTLRLERPTTLFPHLLTGLGAAVVHFEAGMPRPLGTGPFRWSARREGEWVLESNPLHRLGGGRVERLIFRHGMGPGQLAPSLRRGEIDLVQSLPAEDLEALLRDPGFAGGWVEAPLVETYFGLWNQRGRTIHHDEVRRVMIGLLPLEETIWRHLGRFGLAARGLIPPGTLGHPEEEPERLSRDEAIARLAAAGVATPIRIRAALHPVLRSRFSPLLDSWLRTWAGVGIEVEVVAEGMAAFLERWHEPGDLDLLLARWQPEIEDPDGYTFSLLHSRFGKLGGYLAGLDLDPLLEAARAEEEPARREALYRRLQAILLRDGRLLPLFHAVGYRLWGLGVAGLKSRRQPPFVNFAELGKVGPPEAPRAPAIHHGSVRRALRSALSGALPAFEPLASHLVEVAELAPTVFETLTRVGAGSAIVPWLAQRLESSDDGRRYSLLLPRNIRFHDGRRLTTADVRYSLERLTAAGEKVAVPCPPILGADAFRRGECDRLEGLRPIDDRRLELELDRPLVNLPALLASPATAIVPEGFEGSTTDWRHGCVGTGPFRVSRFVPGETLDLAAHPAYWRSSSPRVERLSFSLDQDGEAVADALLAGRISVASFLRNADLDRLLSDPELAPGHRVAPSFSTYYLVLGGRGSLADPARRRLLAQALRDAGPASPSMLGGQTRAHLGRLGIEARGLLPPGSLAGRLRPRPRPRKEPLHDLAGCVVRLAVNSAYPERYRGLWQALQAHLDHLGIEVRLTHHGTPRLIEALRRGEIDLVADRWFGDYPDPDAFLRLFHTAEGPYRHLVSDPAIDEAIEQGRREGDAGRRLALYDELEERLLDGGWVVPLFHEQVHAFGRPEVRGLRLGLYCPTLPWDELALDR